MPETWDDYYTPENLKLLQEIKELEFGEIRVEVHHKRAVNMLIWKKKRLQSNVRDHKELPVIPRK